MDDEYEPVNRRDALAGLSVLTVLLLAVAGSAVYRIVDASRPGTPAELATFDDSEANSNIARSALPGPKATTRPGAPTTSAAVAPSNSRPLSGTLLDDHVQEATMAQPEPHREPVEALLGAAATTNGSESPSRNEPGGVQPRFIAPGEAAKR